MNTSSPIYQWEGTTVQIPGLSASFNNRLTYYRDNTQLNPIRRDSEQFPHVRVTDYTYTKDHPIAWVDCSGSYWSRGGDGNERWCHGKKLRFNAWYDFLYDTEDARRHIVCHEVGHTVGLRHEAGTDSCMATNVGGVVYLNQHHRDHINATY